MKFNVLAGVISLLSASAYAGWAPVQTIENNVALHSETTKFVSMDALQWARVGTVTVAGVPIPGVLAQVNRASVSGGAWVSESVTGAPDWIGNPVNTNDGALFWVQRSGNFNPVGGEDFIKFAQQTNGVWLALAEDSFGSQHLYLQSEILSVIKQQSGNYLAIIASPDATALLWDIRGLLINPQGLLVQGSDASVAKFTLEGINAFANDAVVYSVESGQVFANSINSDGSAWSKQLAYASLLDLSIVSGKNSFVLLSENYSRKLKICSVKADTSLSCDAEIAAPNGFSIADARIQGVSGSQAIISWTEQKKSDNSQIVKSAHVTVGGSINNGPQFSGQAFKVFVGANDNFALQWIDANHVLNVARWTAGAWQAADIVGSDAVNSVGCFTADKPVLAWTNSAQALQLVKFNSGWSAAENVAPGVPSVLDCVADAMGKIEVAGLSAENALVVASFTPDSSPAAPQTPSVPAVPVAGDNSDSPARGGTDTSATTSSSRHHGGALAFWGLGLLLLASAKKNRFSSN